jgi:hypothetical protein
MRNTLQRRLAHLERRAGINTGPRLVIVKSIVYPKGQFGGDPCARAEANGRVWHREAGETRKQFESRVIAEARKHNPDHLSATSIILYPAEEGDADFKPGTSSSGSDP